MLDKTSNHADNISFQFFSSFNGLGAMQVLFVTNANEAPVCIVNDLFSKNIPTCPNHKLWSSVFGSNILG